MNFLKIENLVTIFLLVVSIKSFSQTEKNSNVIYVGSYTENEGFVDGQAEGIYTLHQNPETGKLSMGATVAKLKNPSFVKVSADGKYLFSVSELVKSEAESGFVYSYKINKDNSLTEINKLSTSWFCALSYRN